MKKFHALVAYLKFEASVCGKVITKDVLYTYAIDAFNNNDILEYIYQDYKGH